MKKDRSQEIKKWKKYRSKYVIDYNQAMYIQFVETECLKSSKQNQNKKNSLFDKQVHWTNNYVYPPCKMLSKSSL